MTVPRATAPQFTSVPPSPRTAAAGSLLSLGATINDAAPNPRGGRHPNLRQLGAHQINARDIQEVPASKASIDGFQSKRLKSDAEVSYTEKQFNALKELYQISEHCDPNNKKAMCAALQSLGQEMSRKNKQNEAGRTCLESMTTQLEAATKEAAEMEQAANEFTRKNIQLGMALESAKKECEQLKQQSTAPNTGVVSKELLAQERKYAQQHYDTARDLAQKNQELNQVVLDQQQQIDQLKKLFLQQATQYDVAQRDLTQRHQEAILQQQTQLRLQSNLEKAALQLRINQLQQEKGQLQALVAHFNLARFNIGGFQ